MGMRTMRIIGARCVCERNVSSAFSIWNVSSTLYGTELDSANSSSKDFLSFSLSFAMPPSTSSAVLTTLQLNPTTPSAMRTGW